MEVTVGRYAAEAKDRDTLVYQYKDILFKFKLSKWFEPETHWAVSVDTRDVASLKEIAQRQTAIEILLLMGWELEGWIEDGVPLMVKYA